MKKGVPRSGSISEALYSASAQLVARIFETTPDESALEGLHRAAAVGEEAVPGVVFPLLRPFERTFLNIVSQSDLAVVVHLVELDARRVVRVAELETLAFQPFDGGLGIDPLRRGAERRKGRSHEASRQFDVAIFYHNSFDLGGLLFQGPVPGGHLFAVAAELRDLRFEIFRRVVRVLVDRGAVGRWPITLRHTLLPT